MCGISGFCDFSLNYYDKKPFWETILVQMHETLKHRGPDQAMIDLQPHVGLSHARLSIRDLKSGIQPMTRTFHGKTCSIVYNGEIYNHRELLPELQSAGYRFTTTSDTEIILCAYMHFGKNFVEKLNGIFAFAIWDDTNRELLLYRDRAGTKPLFYTQTGSSFVFGSEPKALFCHPDVTPSIDKNSLQEILAVGPARTSGNGVFTGVKEVMPGHYHIFCPDGQHDILYWDLPCREHKDSYAQTVQTVSFLVRDTVERQMVSDVPVCTFLSGGIDSSIVTALAARHMQKEGKILKALSGFYYVQCQDELITCRARGNFRNDNITPLVGDDVKIQMSDNNTGYVVEILERKNELLRPKVSNIDYSIIIVSVKEPDFSSKLLNKLICLNENSHVDIIIIFTKLDLLSKEELDNIKTIMDYYNKIGYIVLSNTKEDIVKLKKLISRKYVAISGQSGAGKSTLINTLTTNLDIETGEISKHLGRGRHTTRHIEFYQVDDFYIADTPGFSSLDITFIEKEDIQYLFTEFNNYDCKFKPCNHIEEVKCGVKEAVVTGDVLESRYEDYKLLFKEKETQKKKYIKEK